MGLQEVSPGLSRELKVYWSLLRARARTAGSGAELTVRNPGQ